MKIAAKFLSVSIIALGLLASARAAVETYVADPAHSSVNFTIRHVFSDVPGQFTKFNATINVDRDNLENSSAEATIEIGSVSTAQPKRDADLQTPNYFDAAKFPTMTFKSKSWKKAGAETYNVTGDLTIKGVTKEVVLKVTSLGFGPGMRPGTMVSGWKATTTLHRDDFGVSAAPKILGADVDVTINIEAGLKKA
jgi:polyisoprenoid-binding protein YceI